MKYAIGSTIAMIVCFLLGYLITRLVRKIAHKKMKKIVTVLATIGSGLVLLFFVALVYFNIYSHAGTKATEAMKGSDTVTVTEVEGGWLFDGPSTDTALIFYPGAKVEAEAYAPLMLKLAEAGYDCFLADMPLNFPMLGGNIADNFMGNYDYDTWILSGHSLGGILASTYAQNHKDKVDGVVLLASYPTAELDECFTVLSIYGTEDGCLEMDQYEGNKENFPENTTEFIIEGGNHAQYGDYGEQSGDGTATISPEEQQNATVQTISDVFEKKGK